MIGLRDWVDKYLKNLLALRIKFVKFFPRTYFGKNWTSRPKSGRKWTEEEG